MKQVLILVVFFIFGSSCNQTTETEFWNNGEAVFDVKEIFSSERFPNVVTAKDGSIVASLTIPRADPNGSTRSRKRWGFIYYSNLAKEDGLKHVTYQ